MTPSPIPAGPASPEGVRAVLCPIQPHEIPKPLRDGLSDIARRVAVAATVQGQGHDLMLRVYLAGLNHGLILDRFRLATPAGADPGAMR